MEPPTTQYAHSSDGPHIAYQVWGEGPFDPLWISMWFSHLEMLWEFPAVAHVDILYLQGFISNVDLNWESA